MATIQRRETGDGKVKYRVQVRLRGYPPQSETFDRLTDAKAWGERVQAELRAGTYLPQAEARRHTFAELVEAYAANRKANRRHDSKQAHQLDWWAERLGPHFLAAITPARIGKLRDALANGDTPSGKPAAPGTVNRYLAVLRQAFAYAERELEWISTNPVRRVSKPAEPQGRVRFLDDDERARLLAACRGSSDARLYPLVLLALATGARRGELLGLRWEDVDTARGVATLHTTKNRDRRGLVLTAPALAAIADLRQRRVVGVPYIFADRRGRRSFNEYAWREALREARIEDFKFHDLRHSAASYLAMEGASSVELAAVLGHKTLAMVKRYSHLSQGHVADVVGRMADKYLSTPAAKPEAQ